MKPIMDVNNAPILNSVKNIKVAFARAKISKAQNRTISFFESRTGGKNPQELADKN